MVKCSLIVRKQGNSFQLPAIRKVCQDTHQRLMLHPYITASRSIVNILLSLGWIQALDTKRRQIVTPFYIATVVLFQVFPASWGVISHLLVLATSSSTVHNTK